MATVCPAAETHRARTNMIKASILPTPPPFLLKTKNLSLASFGCFPPFCLFLLALRIASVSFPFIPSTRARPASGTTISPYGLLRILSPSIWFACYTAIVVLTKWLLVALRASSPRERFVPLSSRSYLAWWYLNVLLNVWEATGGRWLLDTRLLILFYRLLGARVSRTGAEEGARFAFRLVDRCWLFLPRVLQL